MNLRKETNNLRLRMNHEEVSVKSQRVINNILSLPQFQQAERILFYYPLDNEVDLKELIYHSLRQRKVVILPAVNGEDLDLYIVKDPINDLEQGHFKILEPKKSCEKICKGEVDLFLIPGVVFDDDGNRIGRGKGYYDRFLKDITALKIGVGYEFQIVEEITSEEHDAPMDLVITEEKVRKMIRWS